jgi:malonyl-ACP decarboxylase
VKRQSVALVGMGVLTPVADSPEELSRALRAGHSGVTRGAPGETGSLLRDFQARDWARARLSGPVAAAVAKIATRTALPAATACCVAAQALHQAGLSSQQRARAALVVAGNNLALDYQSRTTLAYHESPRTIRPSHALTCLDTDTVGAVSEVTGVRGEGWTVGAASASGTLALIAGARLLLARETDHCLVVAPAAELSPAETGALRTAGALAVAGDGPPAELCRPFDAQRCGFVRGQAAAAVVLERSADATDRGAPAIAHLVGYGQRLDAHRGSEPDPDGQAQAIFAALDRAGLAPGEIDYVNAHATGSRAGDESEAAALLSVFGPGARPLVNASKAILGHCLSAAGLIEAVATVLQLRDGFVHANPNLRQPIESRLGLVGPSTLTTRLRTAVSNSFAFGGINTSIVLALDPMTRNGGRP